MMPFVVCLFPVGNRRFRVLVDLHVPRYMNAPTRVEKSVVVMKVVDTIRECSGDGGFVKQVSLWFKTTCSDVTLPINLPVVIFLHC